MNLKEQIEAARDLWMEYGKYCQECSTHGRGWHMTYQEWLGKEYRKALIEAVREKKEEKR